MNNPVAIMLLANDIAKRIEVKERFLLALEPRSEVAGFYAPILDPWRGTRHEYHDNSSTRKEAYIDGVSQVISELRKEHRGKVVISRIQVEKAPAIDVPWISAMLDRHFSTHGNSLRYVANTDDGLWIGATPEKLICVDKRTRQFEAMALAGTRAAQSDRAIPWDEKNKYENDLVARYIIERLESVGLSPRVLDAETFCYGDIEHRLRRVIGSCEKADLDVVTEVINPTPALGGYPMERALKIIGDTECHDRSYYGGTITLADDLRHDVYVNLRCCRIADGLITYYGGGGITPESDPESEWNETERKISEIRSVICGS